ncbi:hypothetical protein HZA87_04855 [Candidatus Uhrbacteria bacterium]|nr:hypothetical protein [Candidatus Uhrbacteria bacterium]
MAGRQVCITLYAMSAKREARERAWRSRENKVSMVDLGRAAKALELASVNWRELENHEDILEAAETLRAPGATH